jgi:hypothetical protein
MVFKGMAWTSRESKLVSSSEKIFFCHSITTVCWTYQYCCSLRTGFLAVVGKRPLRKPAALCRVVPRLRTPERCVDSPVCPNDRCLFHLHMKLIEFYHFFDKTFRLNNEELNDSTPHQILFG